MDDETKRHVAAFQRAIRTLKAEVTQLYAESAAMDEFILHRFASQEGVSKESLKNELVELRKKAHQAMLELVEDQNPATAAFLDIREPSEIPTGYEGEQPAP